MPPKKDVSLKKEKKPKTAAQKKKIAEKSAATKKKNKEINDVGECIVKKKKATPSTVEKCITEVKKNSAKKVVKKASPKKDSSAKFTHKNNPSTNTKGNELDYVYDRKEKDLIPIIITKIIKYSPPTAKAGEKPGRTVYRIEGHASNDKTKKLGKITSEALAHGFSEAINLPISKKKRVVLDKKAFTKMKVVSDKVVKKKVVKKATKKE